MSSFTYYSLLGFGEQCREQYGFSDVCIIGNCMIVTGQTGVNPYMSRTSPDLEDQNIKSLIERTLQQANHPAYGDRNLPFEEHCVELEVDVWLP
ncbi:hypothetical protein BDW72DRAFT_207698 [Aspergillus terricola var. indicus]